MKQFWNQNQIYTLANATLFGKNWYNFGKKHNFESFTPQPWTTNYQGTEILKFKTKNKRKKWSNPNEKIKKQFLITFTGSKRYF